MPTFFKALALITKNLWADLAFNRSGDKKPKFACAKWRIRVDECDGGNHDWA